MWYGNFDDDFGTYENLAGREQRGFAFSHKRNWYLRDDRFDDSVMVTAAVDWIVRTGPFCPPSRVVLSRPAPEMVSDLLMTAVPVNVPAAMFMDAPGAAASTAGCSAS